MFVRFLALYFNYVFIGCLVRLFRWMQLLLSSLFHRDVVMFLDNFSCLIMGFCFVLFCLRFSLSTGMLLNLSSRVNWLGTRMYRCMLSVNLSGLIL